MNTNKEDFSIEGLRATVEAAKAAISDAAPGFAPEVAVILGSGLGALTKLVKRVATLNYSEIPGFHATAVESHSGRLILGEIEGVRVALLAGRFHLYEGHAPQAWLAPIRALHRLGASTLLVTNAAGALHDGLKIPSLMIIRDHINGLGRNPLQGLNDEAVGVRFPDMTDLYDPDLCGLLREAAQEADVAIGEGVYWGTLGPTFETAAEVRMMATLGGDVVGMSTISEVIAARHCGMKIAGVSSITNATAGVASTPQTMEEVVAGGAALSDGLMKLVEGFMRKISRSQE